MIRALIAAIKSETDPSVKAEMIDIILVFSGSLRQDKMHEEYEDLKALLILQAREDPYPKVKLNAIKLYLDLFWERSGEAHFVDSILRDVLVNPEKYGRDDSFHADNTLETAINYLTYLPRMARFVRKTLSFSKSDRFHAMALRLFIHHHNQLCIS